MSAFDRTPGPDRGSSAFRRAWEATRRAGMPFGSPENTPDGAVRISLAWRLDRASHAMLLAPEVFEGFRAIGGGIVSTLDAMMTLAAEGHRISRYAVAVEAVVKKPDLGDGGCNR